MKKQFAIATIALLLLLSACSDSDSVATDSGVATTTDSILNTAHFRSIVSSTTADCTLGNGSVTTCHQLTFAVNEIRDGSGAGALVDDEAGPFCPSGYETTDGGVGIYDGATGAGFQNLSKTLWDNMAADGYDVIDESNNTICIQDPGANTSTGSNCDSYCLNAAADDDLTVTFLIPVTPELLATPSDIGSVEPVGVSLDGVPMTGTPPSVVDGPFVGAAGGNIPSLDHCGGHHDPAGYYHWHLIPESADAVHSVFGTDDQANCGNTITQDSTALTGYAGDGYPVYAHQDMVDGTATTPSDLDECSGHTAATEEFPDGVYHYHASLSAPNMPECLMGASVDRRSSPLVQ